MISIAFIKPEIIYLNLLLIYDYLIHPSVQEKQLLTEFSWAVISVLENVLHENYNFETILLSQAC